MVLRKNRGILYYILIFTLLVIILLWITWSYRGHPWYLLPTILTLIFVSIILVYLIKAALFRAQTKRDFMKIRKELAKKENEKMTGEELDEEIKETRNMLLSRYYEVIKPQIMQGMSGSYESFKQANNDYLNWQNQTVIFGFEEEFVELYNDAFDLISDGYKIFLNEARVQISGAANPEQLKNAIDKFLALEKDIELIDSALPGLNEELQSLISEIYTLFPR